MGTREEEEGPQDRRAEEREIAVLRVAKLITDHGEQLCRIRNISPGGVMAEAPGTLRTGEPVAIELKSGGKAEGRIAWVDDGRIGIAFHAPIDPRDVLAVDPTHRPRALRVAVAAEARLNLGSIFRRVPVEDISLGGIRVRLDDDAAIGTKVLVTIQGLPNLPGLIRWQSSGYAGIAFDQPLELDTLALWLAGFPTPSD